MASGAVEISYSGDGVDPGGAVRDAVNAVCASLEAERMAVFEARERERSEALQSGSQNVRALLDRQFGGEIAPLAHKMADQQHISYSAARRQVERALDQSRALTPQAVQRITDAADKRLRETKALQPALYKPRPAPRRRPKARPFQVRMDYFGSVYVSKDKRTRSLGSRDFSYVPSESGDPFGQWLAAYNWADWEGEGMVSFEVSEQSGEESEEGEEE